MSRSHLPRLVTSQVFTSIDNMNHLKTNLFLATLVTAGILTNISQPSFADKPQQKRQVRFYCGQSFDSSSQKIVPTTFAATSERKEPVAVIRWKFGFVGYSTQNRCNIVSTKFQTAWADGRLRFLVAGASPATGQGIICGVADREQACNDSTMLFTLKNEKQAQTAIASIERIKTGTTSNPGYQSSGSDPVDLEELLK
ncbi:MAG: COP23 domain-containing protein [Chamaesiphon sp.]|nr:COP23 domain-containing protein [Chamaesiphon sp.]